MQNLMLTSYVYFEVNYETCYKRGNYYYNHLPVDLTVTTDKLKDLFVLIWDRDRVDAIGRKLCLPQLKIRQIQRNYRHPLERKEAYLDLYAYDHPCPSWIDVAEILLSLKLSQQFNMVNETYIKGMFTNGSVSIRVVLCHYLYTLIQLAKKRNKALIQP